MHVVKAANGSLTANDRPITAATGGVMVGPSLMTLSGDGRLEGSSEGDAYALLPRKAWSPSAKELTAIAGRYASSEAHATLIVSLKKAELQIAPDDRPSFARKLMPAYTDAFAFGDNTARLKRDGQGKVVGLILSNSRVWALPFQRLP